MFCTTNIQRYLQRQPHASPLVSFKFIHKMLNESESWASHVCQPAGIKIRLTWMWCEKTIVSCGERRMRRRWHGNIYIRLPDLFFCNSELCDVAFREKELAKKYHDKLFKEYCIADLSRYKENKVCGVFFRFFLLWSFKIAYPLIFVTTELTSLYCFTSLVLDGALKMKLYLEKVIDVFSPMYFFCYTLVHKALLNRQWPI